MTIVEKVAKEKFGSVRKMFFLSNLKPGTVYPVLAGYRKPWPALRSRLSEVLELKEEEIFGTDGWLKKVS